MNKTGFAKQKIVFSGLSNTKTQNKTAVMGEQLWDLIFKRDPLFGGYFVGGFGIMGSGKTSLMHRIANRIIKENPDEIIFWREPLGNPLQAYNSNNPVQVLCERRYPVKVMKLAPHGTYPTDDITIHKFTGFQELLKMVKPQTLNVIYFNKLETWIRLLEKLKLWKSWQTVLWDEAEDICPLRCSGKRWLLNEEFTNSIKQIRKSRISLIVNSQNQMDIDYRLTSKLMVFIYLYGCRDDPNSPVYKKATQSLKLGQGWIDYGHSLFGQINFKPITPKPDTYVILPTDRKTRKK